MIEKVYVGYWFWGRPSPEQLWLDLQELFAPDQAGLRPDHARGPGEVGGEPGPGARLSACLAFAAAVWLFPVAFAAHVLEEAPGFTAWARRHGSSRYTEADFIRNNALGLAMTIVGTTVVSRSPSRPAVFSYFAIVLTQQAVFNTLFHSGTTVAYREYSPGRTALAGFLPSVASCGWRGARPNLGPGPWAAGIAPSTPPPSSGRSTAVKSKLLLRDKKYADRSSSRCSYSSPLVGMP